MEHEDKDAWDELDEALVADECREFLSPVNLDMAGVEGFEVSEAAEVESDENGDDLALCQASCSISVGLGVRQLALLKVRKSQVAEVIDMAEKGE